ncbi:MAG: permease-like cell division protein FtsX [Sporichthyaceae bacterium]
MRLSFLASEIFTGLRRNLTMTVATIITSAVALSLIGLAMLTGKQVETMKDYWYDKVEVSIFLCLATDDSTPSCRSGEVSDAQRTEIRTDLEKLKPLVAEVYYESKLEAYEQFKQQFADDAIVGATTPDQLPDSFRVKLSDPSKYEIVTSAFTGRPGVERVVDQKKILAPFFKAMRALSVGSLVLAGTVLAAALLLIVNTIRISAFSRRRETSIKRLVGASNLAIRLPFVLEGVVTGVAGAVIATGLVCGAKWGGVDHYLVRTYRFTEFIGWEAVASTVPWLFVFGVGVSALVSSLTLRRYLKV